MLDPELNAHAKPKRPGTPLHPSKPPKKPRLNQTAPFVSSFPAPAPKPQASASGARSISIAAVPKFAFPAATPKKKPAPVGRAAAATPKFALPETPKSKQTPCRASRGLFPDSDDGVATPAKPAAPITAVKFALPAPKSAVKPRRPPKDPFPDSDDNDSTMPAKPARTAKPPALAFTHVAAAPTTPAKPLRAAKPPALPTPVHKPAPTPMRAPRPPAFPLPSPEPTKQPLRVPVLPGAPPAAGAASSSFRPLSTTRLALATTEELARARDPDADDPEKRALGRGMDLSPQKASKFRRSSSKVALADVAKQIIDRESVALRLWQQETRVVRDARRLGPALTLTVRAVLQRNEHSGAPAAPRGALAACGLPDGTERTFFFSASGEAIHGMSPIDVQDGARVMVWEPWIELKDPANEAPSIDDDPFSATVAVLGDARAPVLLCSRFVVAR